MKHSMIVAITFIAVCSISTRASGQNVYRCGNTYSQKPCADGIEVNVQDARTPAQKAESEAAARREASTANAMEKARLQEEARLQSSSTKLTARPQDKTKKPTSSDTNPVASKNRKTHAKKKQEPAYFTARGASTEKPKSAASKAQ